MTSSPPPPEPHYTIPSVTETLQTSFDSMDSLPLLLGTSEYDSVMNQQIQLHQDMLKQNEMVWNKTCDEYSNDNGNTRGLSEVDAIPSQSLRDSDISNIFLQNVDVMLNAPERENDFDDTNLFDFLKWLYYDKVLETYMFVILIKHQSLKKQHRIRTHWRWSWIMKRVDGRRKLEESIVKKSLKYYVNKSGQNADPSNWRRELKYCWSSSATINPSIWLVDEELSLRRGSVGRESRKEE